jgi:probable rRNA maturation factor
MLAREDVLRAGADENAPGMLGDIILAQGVCSREAAEKGISVESRHPPDRSRAPASGRI